MKKLSGLVLDVRDDYDGAVLRSIFPSDGEIPAFVKNATVITPELAARIPDDLFAVVLHDEDVVLRKFACVDAGNTALSIEYFLKTAHKLPLEAQVVAATNLITACDWYGINPPEQLQKVAMSLGLDALEKISLGLGTALNLGLTAPGMARQAKMNLGATEGAGHLVVTPSQRKEMLKGAEASGTPPMPISAPQGAPAALKTVTVKSAGSAGFVGDLGIQGEHHATAPEDNSGKSTSAEQPKRLPQSAPLRPHVNVAGKEAPGQLTLKKAELYALPSQQRYPLDGMDQVKEASAYFDEYSCRMTPETRREYCVNMVKRARALDLPVSSTAAAYGAEGYADAAQIKIALDGRKLLIVNDIYKDVLDKIAAERLTMKPEQFATILSEFDKVASLDYYYDQHVLDPYLSTYGEKRAADSIAVGNDFMSVNQLKRLAAVGVATVKHRFGRDFVEKFVKDPVGTFNGMPLDQKKVMMRMASDNGAVDGETTV
jgi:hypothetical protein